MQILLSYCLSTVNPSPVSGLKRHPVKPHNSEIIYPEKTQDPENHTLLSGTYPYRSNKEAPPPPELIHRKWYNRCTGIYIESYVSKKERLIDGRRLFSYYYCAVADPEEGPGGPNILSW